MWLSSKKLRVALIFLPLFGCGYTLQHRLKEPLASAKGVFIPIFRNDTEEVGAERFFTNMLIRELRSHRSLPVMAKDDSDYTLEGTLTALTLRPSALTEPGFQGLDQLHRIPTELEVSATVLLRLYRTKTLEQIWAQNYSAARRVATPVDRTYDFQAPSSLGLITQSIGEAQFSEVARDIVRDVYDEMVEFF